MANFKMKFDNNSINKAINGIEKATIKKIQAAIKSADVIEEIKQVYNDAVDAAKTPFRLDMQPDSDELIGEFGVGQGGEPDTDKIEGAWEELLLDVGKSAKLLGGASRTKDTIGTYSITIDKEKFYNSDLATVTNDSKNNAGEIIPWMRWYIEGEKTPGYYLLFDDQGRTGFGAMVKITKKTKKFYTPWSSPARAYIWDNFADEVTAKIDKKAKSLARKILAKLKKK